MKKELEKLEKRAREELERVETRVDLKDFKKKYLGKSGRLSLILGKIKDLGEKERKLVGKKANDVKSWLEKKVEEERKKLEESVEKGEKIDVTIPVSAQRIKRGHLHPLTQVKREIMDIFQKMGFEIAEGPEVETDWYNFEALNMAEHHPARDMWDTFWLEVVEEGKPLLLRTHTSPVQIRYMEKHQPPIKIVASGKVFRHEKKDASHELQLYQLEGLMVGKEVNAAHFKAVVVEFFSRFFGKDLEIRMRPSFFPFTEPSFEIDVECVVCGGEGCSTCSKTGWLEMAGAGMVHPNVFKAVGFNPDEVQGFAFGLGIDRLAMMRYKIPHISWFHSGDLRFLEQF